MSEEKIRKLLEKNHWDKIQKKYLNADTATKVELANVCADFDSDESTNVLINLLHDSESTVQLAAVHSLGKIGNDHATAQLQWLLSNISPEQTDLRDAIHSAISNVRHKQ